MVKLKNCQIGIKISVVVDMDHVIMIVVTKIQKDKKTKRQKDKKTKRQKLQKRQNKKQKIQKGLWPLKTFACVSFRYRKRHGNTGNTGSGLW